MVMGVKPRGGIFLFGRRAGNGVCSRRMKKFRNFLIWSGVNIKLTDSKAFSGVIKLAGSGGNDCGALAWGDGADKGAAICVG